jgi:two-component system chemotaxis sensor kinase CheA
MVLAALAEHGDLLGSTPHRDTVEVFEGRAIEAFIQTDAPADGVAIAARLADVADVAVEEAVAAPLAAPRPTKRASGTVRIDAGRLDELMHVMAELVVHRARLEPLAAQADVPGLSNAVNDLGRTTDTLRAMVRQIRMIPVESVFLRFPRMVRDLSAKLGKQVELVLTGKELELDRTVVEMLGNPIVHLVRNSLDHGLEPPEQRVAAGKRPVGTLEMSAHHAEGEVIITVRDDGRGIEPRKVAARAVERGLLPAGADATIGMDEAIELLFTPDFSTAEEMSDISGRGVGMDAVRETVRELGGDVVVTSKPGAGTTVSIHLPLTLAIMPALQVGTNGVPLAIPLDRAA